MSGPGPAAPPKVLKPDALAGRSAFVSGAGSGIGRAVALRLAELGMTVFGTGRREARLAETAALCEGLAGRFLFAPCDLRDSGAAAALVRTAGDAHGIDLLVNNAGGQFFAAATDISARGWAAVLDINLTAVFTVVRAAHPYLRASRGAVVSLSLSGVERGSTGLAHSVAARAGVLGLTRTLALEWAGDGIRLNCIGPGTVMTGALAAGLDAATRERLLAATPLGRTTSAEEVAELVAFLATPAAALMTGQLIQIDGGSHLGPGLHLLP